MKPYLLASPRGALTIGMAAAVLVSTLAGCATTATPQSASETAATTTASLPAASPSETSSDVTDAESCAAFSDVSTILFNATVGLRQGRMTQQEYDGWMRLATRVLDRVPVRGEGDVSDAITTLKAVAPPVAAGSNAPTVINTDEWNNAAPLSEACEATVHVFSVEGFTGG